MGAIDGRILDEAADWLARLHASDFSAREQAALMRWRQRSAKHEAVWQRVQQLKFQMASVPSPVAMTVLNRSRSGPSRRNVLRTAVLACTAPALGWIAHRVLPWDVWRADYRTAKGERRTVTLADGSRVLLNTDSAIQARLDGEVREVRHIAGEVWVETAHAGGFQHLPFVVQTADGRMRALGTRFIVRKEAQGTLLSVLDGAVQVSPARSSQTVVVQAGGRLRFDAQGLGAVSALPAQADAWTQGVLYAQNMRLQDFLAELGRYREGLLHCAPGAAELRVSGVFQLHDTDRILALLAQTLPIRIRARTRYWVAVERS